MSKHGLDRKEQKQNTRAQHDMMVNHRSSENAREWFRRPAYQAKSLIRAQGEQIEHDDVLSYLDKHGHDSKGEMPDGQESS